MSSLIDTLAKRRYQVMIALALSYLFFQSVSLSFIPDLTGLPKSTVNFIEDVGLAFYFIALAFGGFYTYIAMRGGAAVIDALKDELVKDHLRRSAVFGYKGVFLITAGLFSYLQFGHIDSEDVARIILTSALVIFLLRFAFLEAKHA